MKDKHDKENSCHNS